MFVQDLEPSARPSSSDTKLEKILPDVVLELYKIIYQVYFGIKHNDIRHNRYNHVMMPISKIASQ